MKSYEFMKVQSASSPNFAANEIPVEFLVLHYTACDLKRTLEIFSDRSRKVCAHFIIDTDGTCYDLGGFLNGPIKQGAHAGKSELEISEGRFESFNQFSIGIEIVNLNGNMLEYTKEQYETLGELTRHLQKRFPKLKNSERIIGHEHIAFFRGKCDPGLQFDWKKYLKSVGLIPAPIHEFFAFQPGDIEEITAGIEFPKPTDDNPDFWSSLSTRFEQFTASKFS